MLDLAVPEHEQEGGTYVIPGHGRLCDEADVLEYRDMVTIIRDRVEDMVETGHDAGAGEGGQADARLRPALRRETGAWTTAMFVEAVYRDVSNPAAKPVPAGAKNAPAAKGKR